MEPIARTLREGELLEQLAWLQGLARSLVRDASSADDLVQDTWLAASKHAPALDGSGLRNWLARVARNFARRGARAQERRARRESAVARPEAQVDDVVARGELQQRLAAAVMSLGEPERSAVLLRYLDGLSAIEIAERQGVTHVAARKRISRGLAKLREKLDAQHGGDRKAWIVALHSWVGRGEPVAGSSTGIVSGVLVMLGKLVAAAALVAAAWFGWNSFGGEASEARVADVARADAQVETRGAAPTNVDTRRTETQLSSTQSAHSLQLVDEAGSPRSGFTAVLLDDTRWLATKLSDASGRIELSNEPRPTALIVARAGFMPMRFELDSEGGEASLLVPSGARVAGRLLYASASRLSRLELTDDRDAPALAKLDDEALRELEKLGVSGRKRVLTLDESGEFQFDGLDESWTGAIELPDSWRFVRGPGDFSEDDRCLLLLAPTPHLNLAIRSPLVVRGRVVDARTRAGVGGVRVRCSRLDGAAPEATTDATGAFELPLATPRHALDEWAGTVLLELDLVRRSVNVRTPWRELERTRELGEFELSRGRRLELRVTDDAGVPIPAASALVSLAEYDERPRVADLSGRIVFSALPEDWRPITVRADGHSQVLVAPTTEERVNVVLARRNRIDVRVVTQTGAPVSEYGSIGLRHSTEAEQPGWIHSAGDGRWVLSDLAPGALVTLHVWSVNAANSELTELMSRDVTAPPRLETVEIELVVPTRSLGIHGRVVDESGRGLPRATVHIENSTASMSMPTHEDGRFGSEELETSIDEIEHLEVTRPGFVPIVLDGVKLREGEELVFTLARGHALDALVLDARGKPTDSKLLLAVFEGGTSVLGTPLGDGRFHFDAVPNLAGELQLEFGGVTHSTPIGVNDSFVSLTLPATGELQLTVAPGSYDESSMVCVLVQRAGADAEPTRKYFRKRDGELEPQTLSLPEGRYRIQLESRGLGGGASNVETHGVARDVEVAAGKRLALTVP